MPRINIGNLVSFWISLSRFCPSDVLFGKTKLVLKEINIKLSYLTPSSIYHICLVELQMMTTWLSKHASSNTTIDFIWGNQTFDQFCLHQSCQESFKLENFQHKKLKKHVLYNYNYFDLTVKWINTPNMMMICSFLCTLVKYP